MPSENLEYVVVRGFHLGEAKLNLSAGERLQYDGSRMTRIKTGRTYEVTALNLAVVAGHVVQDTGDVEFVPRSQVDATPARPAPKVVVQDHEERVVGRINVDKSEAQVAKSTEEVARTTAETAERRVVVADQRVVGKANVRRTPGAAIVGEGEASAALQQQAEEATPVRKVSRSQALMNDMLRAEGMDVSQLSPTAERQATVIADASEGVVVGSIKTLDERKAEMVKNGAAVAEAYKEPELTEEQKAALAEDAKLAAAKRAGTAKTAADAATETATSEETSEAPSVELDDLGYPVSYPTREHWKVRLQWCIDNADNVPALKVIFGKASSGFRNQMKQALPGVSFE